MLKSLAGVALLVSATNVWAANQPTDFGVRTVGVRTNSGQATIVATNSTSKALLESNNISPVRSYDPVYANPSSPTRSGVNLRAVAELGSQWGRVTSTIRSIAHNRAVGGVRNSFHLRGRAIDIARRPGVTHAAIAAAFRNAGYYLIESLDEGDHSHFAFGSAGGAVALARAVRGTKQRSTATRWGMVTVASAALK